MQKIPRPKLNTFLSTLKKIYKALQVKSPAWVFDHFSISGNEKPLPVMQLIPAAFDVENKSLLLKYSLILTNALVPYTENEHWYELYLAMDNQDRPVYFDSSNLSENSGHINLDFYVIRAHMYSKVGKIINRYVNRATPKLALPKKENVQRYRLTGCFWIFSGRNLVTLPKSTFLLGKNRKIQSEEFEDKLFNTPESLIPILLPDV